MKITHETGDPDAWVCTCGNTPSDSGFHPVNKYGKPCEPTDESWDTNNYACYQCGKIIDQDTLEIVDSVEVEKLLEQDKELYS